MARLGFIGTGHMASAMVRHLAPKGHDIAVTPRGQTVAQALDREFDTVRIAEAPEILATSDLVFLCLRPEVAAGVLEGVTLRGDQRIVSVMAGISSRQLRAWCGPAAAITLMLPMELIAHGGCPIAVWPETPEITALFAPENRVIPVQQEVDLAACFAATTLISAIAETLDVGTDWLGERIGGDAAQLFVGSLATGMLNIHADQPERFARLRDSLATPGTLNLAMVRSLRAIALPETLRGALTDLER